MTCDPQTHPEEPLDDGRCPCGFDNKDCKPFGSDCLYATESRTARLKRISAMAGIAPDGSILPPPAGFSIDRTAKPWWRTDRGEKP